MKQTSPMNDSTQLKAEILEHVIEAWTQLQAQQPLVHCITNSVAANYVANILLASGASPAMIDNTFEAESFAKISSAISINTGTPTPEQTEAMKITAKTCLDHDKPWVLDPVGYGAVLAWRSETVDELLKFRPTIIRGNASEISSLAGNQNQTKGVDSLLNSADVYQQASVLLQQASCIAISGESDFIIAKELPAVIKINGGSFLQPRITATGCALGALIAAYCAVAKPSIAAIAAHIHFAVSGKLAFEKAKTVGSFNVAFLDELYTFSREKIQRHADFEIIK